MCCNETRAELMRHADQIPGVSSDYKRKLVQASIDLAFTCHPVVAPTSADRGLGHAEILNESPESRKALHDTRHETRQAAWRSAKELLGAEHVVFQKVNTNDDPDASLIFDQSREVGL